MKSPAQELLTSPQRDGSCTKTWCRYEAVVKLRCVFGSSLMLRLVWSEWKVRRLENKRDVALYEVASGVKVREGGVSLVLR